MNGENSNARKRFFFVFEKHGSNLGVVVHRLLVLDSCDFEGQGALMQGNQESLVVVGCVVEDVCIATVQLVGHRFLVELVHGSTLGTLGLPLEPLLVHLIFRLLGCS